MIFPQRWRDYCQNKFAVIGVAAYWGKILVHTAGFKAQYGRILAISDHSRSDAAIELERSAILEGVV
jgi:hypothetical protein